MKRTITIIEKIVTSKVVTKSTSIRRIDITDRYVGKETILLPSEIFKDYPFDVDNYCPDRLDRELGGEGKELKDILLPPNIEDAEIEDKPSSKPKPTKSSKLKETNKTNEK